MYDKSWVTKTLLHILELAVAGAIVIGLIWITKGDDSARQLIAPILGLIGIGGVFKGARANEDVPVGDYVNE